MVCLHGPEDPREAVLGEQVVTVLGLSRADDLVGIMTERKGQEIARTRSRKGNFTRG